MKQSSLGSKESKFLHRVVAPQLRARKVKAESKGGAEFSIDHCIIEPENPQRKIGTILLLPGFGSGWNGTVKLGYDLAQCGYRIVMPSMPGYGNSSDVFLPCYENNADIEVLHDFIEKIFGEEKLHLVGHSMGAETITRFAYHYPEHVSSLNLLCPAGFEKRGQLEVAVKFLLNGLLHALKFKGDETWAELEKHLPKEKSPFSWSRLHQRLKEWQKICNPVPYSRFDRFDISCGENASFVLIKFPKNIPVQFIWGEKDFVFPRKKSLLEKAIFDWSRYSEKISLPLYHNVTMLGSEETAAAIDEFIFNIQQRENLL